MMRCAAFLAFGMVACAANSAPVKWDGSTRAEKLRALDRIADMCRAPRSIFRLGEDGELRVRPHPETRYEQVDCALTRLREAGFPMAAMGFVGNAGPADENSNAQ
jgi:hypothetical protein